MRIKHDALLPNRFRADAKECFVIVGGFGDLGSERAYLRAETLTCVRTDGGVIEVPLDAYAVGEDGKVGIRGRLVSKQGALLAKALQAGFLTAFSKVFTQVPSTSFSNAATSGQVQFQSMLTPQAAEAGFAGGVGGAMDKLADYAWANQFVKDLASAAAVTQASAWLTGPLPGQSAYRVDEHKVEITSGLRRPNSLRPPSGSWARRRWRPFRTFMIKHPGPRAGRRSVAQRHPATDRALETAHWRLLANASLAR